MNRRTATESTCPTCKMQFVSRIKGKIYCSMKCYQADPKTLERVRKQSRVALGASLAKRGFTEIDRIETKCAHCGKILVIKPSQLSRRNFCNHTHYRLYQSQRFDRWIASPQKIALPQNYDEFLTQDELPCIVDGCNWKGTFLGAHINFEHGITAKQFKVLAGFNIGSGLVTPELSARMREAALIRILDGRMMLVPNELGSKQKHTINGYVSLEAREHISKTMFLLRAEFPQIVQERTCRWCSGEVLKDGPCGNKLYCSVECRDKFYKNQRWNLLCSHCGNKFFGKKFQELRSRRGLVVCCSTDCRNAHNLALTINHVKHRAKFVARQESINQEDSHAQDAD